MKFYLQIQIYRRNARAARGTMYIAACQLVPISMALSAICTKSGPATNRKVLHRMFVLYNDAGTTRNHDAQGKPIQRSKLVITTTIREHNHQRGVYAQPPQNGPLNVRFSTWVTSCSVVRRWKVVICCSVGS